MDSREICVGHRDTVALALRGVGGCQLQHPQPNPAALSSVLDTRTSLSQKHSGEQTLLKAARAAAPGPDRQHEALGRRQRCFRRGERDGKPKGSDRSRGQDWGDPMVFEGG